MKINKEAYEATKNQSNKITITNKETYPDTEKNSSSSQASKKTNYQKISVIDLQLADELSSLSNRFII